MTKDQRERALEALGRVGGWVRDSAGRLMPPNAAAALRDLATIRAALEPSAVDRVLEMGGEVHACVSESSGMAMAKIPTYRRYYGPDPDAAAQKALDALKEVER